jgi:hypothetical protein
MRYYRRQLDKNLSSVGEQIMQKHQEFSPHLLRPTRSLGHPSAFQLNAQGQKKGHGLHATIKLQKSTGKTSLLTPMLEGMGPSYTIF